VLYNLFCRFTRGTDMKVIGIATFCCVLIITGLSQVAAGQDDEDVQSWNDIQLTLPLSKKVDVFTKLTMRIGKNISRLNDGRVAVGVVWKPNASWSISPFYWLINARNTAGQFRQENRLNLAVSYRFPIKKFGLIHRSTYEKRLRAPVNTWRYRAMLTVEKDLPKSWIPKAKFFVADEVFYDSATGRFSRNRFSVGLSKALSKQLSLDVYYTRQNDGFSHPGDLNIVWTAWKIKL
jgi:hypothetical protein